MPRSQLLLLRATLQAVDARPMPLGRPRISAGNDRIVDAFVERALAREGQTTLGAAPDLKQAG